MDAQDHPDHLVRRARVAWEAAERAAERATAARRRVADRRHARSTDRAHRPCPHLTRVGMRHRAPPFPEETVESTTPPGDTSTVLRARLVDGIAVGVPADAVRELSPEVAADLAEHAARQDGASAPPRPPPLSTSTERSLHRMLDPPGPRPVP